MLTYCIHLQNRCALWQNEFQFHQHFGKWPNTNKTNDILINPRPNNKKLCWEYLLCFGVIYGCAASVLLSVRVWYTHKDTDFMVHSSAPCTWKATKVVKTSRFNTCDVTCQFWLVAGDWSAKTWGLLMTGSHLCCQVNFRKKNKLCFVGALFYYHQQLAWIYSSCEHCLHFLCACDCGSTGQIKSTLKNQTFFVLLYTYCFECTLSCHFSTVNTKHIQTLLRDSATVLSSHQPAPVVQWWFHSQVPLRWQWNGKLFILTHQRGKQKENLFFFLLISSKQHTKQPTATDCLSSGKVFNTSSFNSWSVLGPGTHLPASTHLLMTPAGQDYCHQEL